MSPASSPESWGVGPCPLNYIDDFEGVATSKAEATWHFGMFQAILKKLELEEAKHNLSLPPSPPPMSWSG